MMDALVTRLRSLLTKATPGPWDVDTNRNEDGEYGSGPDTSIGYDDFLIGAQVRGNWATLLTTENSTEKSIEEDYDDDYHRAWDAVGEANAQLATAAVNALPELLEHINPSDFKGRCLEIADRVVPEYRREQPGRANYSCTGVYAKRWQAAWDGACIALGGDPADHRS